MITISELQKINGERSIRWHNGNRSQWTILEWCGAMAGETGEACNVAKKLRRLAFALPNRQAGLSETDALPLRMKLAKEIADSILYGLIILSELDYDAYAILREVFNTKSNEYGFPELLP